MNRIRTKKLVSLLTLLAFMVTQAGIFPGGKAWAFPEEVNLPSSGFSLELAPGLGTIQALHSGSGSTLIHVQTAHGNYEAQKKIQAILHELHDRYGFKLLLLEGSAFKLRPGLLRLFPDDASLSLEVLDRLTKKSLVKGAELFLAEEKEAEAQGIETLEAYVKNGSAFRSVLLQKEKTGEFLQDLNLQLERLTGPYLGRELRDFLNRWNDFETKQVVSLESRLLHLKDRARQVLALDLSHPRSQIDWPMLVRIYKLKEIEAKMDRGAFEKEREDFLSVIARTRSVRRDLVRNDIERIQSLLASPLSQHQLPDPETELLFERMVSYLPPDFPYDSYPNVKRFIAHLILQSELKGDRLLREVEHLQNRIAAKLARTPEEEKILALLKDLRLLKRLFALELSPDDYDEIITSPLRGGRQADEAIPEIASASSGIPPRNDLRPTRLLPRFLEINHARRVRDVSFSHLDEMDILFEKALSFYQGTKVRDEAMLQGIEEMLRKTGEEKAVIITGGFHSRPFRDYFSKKGYNYALISPHISGEGGVEGRKSYLDSVLRFRAPEALSTYETPSLALARAEVRQHGFDPERIRNAVRESVLETVKGRAGKESLIARYRESSYEKQWTPARRAEGHATRSESRTPQSLSGQTRAEVRTQFRFYSKLSGLEKLQLRNRMGQWFKGRIVGGLNPKWEILIAYAEKEPVGVQVFEMVESVKRAYGRGLHVDEAWRRNGLHIGTLIRENVLRYLQERDYQTFSVVVERSPDAQAFHREWAKGLGEAAKVDYLAAQSPEIYSITVDLKKYLPRAEGHATRSESRTPQSLSGQTRAEVRSGGKEDRARGKKFREWASGYRHQKIDMSEGDLAEQFQLHRVTISRILKEYGIKVHQGRSPAVEFKKWAESNQGKQVEKTPAGLAAEFGISEKTVRRHAAQQQIGLGRNLLITQKVPTQRGKFWTPLKITTAIFHLSQSGFLLFSETIIQDRSSVTLDFLEWIIGERRTPHALYMAARRYFGSWNEALRKAGVPQEKIRKDQKMMHWTPLKITTAIHYLGQENIKLYSKAIRRDRSPNTIAVLEYVLGQPASGDALFQAGIRHFGSWDAALRAAGLDPFDIRRNFFWRRDYVSTRPSQEEWIHDQLGTRIAGLLGGSSSDPSQPMELEELSTILAHAVGKLPPSDQEAADLLIDSILQGEEIPEGEISQEKVQDILDRLAQDQNLKNFLSPRAEVRSGSDVQRPQPAEEERLSQKRQEAERLTRERNYFLELIHILNRYWWLIEEGKTIWPKWLWPHGPEGLEYVGYHDKSALGFRYHRRILKAGWILEPSAILEWDRPTFEQKKLIVRDIVNDRISKGYLDNDAMRSSGDRQRMFDLLQTLDVSVYPPYDNQGKKIIATAPIGHFSPALYPLDMVLDVVNRYGEFKRSPVSLFRATDFLTRWAAILPQALRFGIFYSAEWWINFLKSENIPSWAAGFARSNSQGHFVYFLGKAVTPELVLHEFVHILQQVTSLQDPLYENLRDWIKQIKNANALSRTLHEWTEAILDFYESHELSLEFGSRFYQQLFEREAGTFYRVVEKKHWETMKEFIKALFDMRDRNVRAEILSYLRRYYLSMHPLVPLPKGLERIQGVDDSFVFPEIGWPENSPSYKKGEELAAGIISGMPFAPGRAVELLEELNAKPPFNWGYKEEGVRARSFLESGTGLEGFLDGFQLIRKSGIVGQWSLAFHAGNQEGRGDIPAYFDFLLDGVSGLEPVRKALQTLGDEVPPAAHLGQRIQRDLKAIGLMNSLVKELSRRAEVRLAERPSTPPRSGPIGRRAEVRSDSNEPEPGMNLETGGFEVRSGMSSDALEKWVRRSGFAPKTALAPAHSKDRETIRFLADLFPSLKEIILVDHDYGRLANVSKGLALDWLNEEGFKIVRQPKGLDALIAGRDFRIKVEITRKAAPIEIVLRSQKYEKFRRRKNQTPVDLTLVKYPGWGGELAEEDWFWERVISNTRPGGIVMVTHTQLLEDAMKDRLELILRTKDREAEDSWQAVSWDEWAVFRKKASPRAEGHATRSESRTPQSLSGQTRTEVRRAIRKKRISERGGVYVGKNSPGGAFLPLAGQTFPTIRKPSRFQTWTASLLTLQKVNHPDQANQNEPAERKNANRKGLGAQGERGQDSREVYRKGAYGQLDQILSSLRRQIESHSRVASPRRYIVLLINPIFGIIISSAGRSSKFLFKDRRTPKPNSFKPSASRVGLSSPRAEVRSERGPDWQEGVRPPVWLLELLGVPRVQIQAVPHRSEALVEELLEKLKPEKLMRKIEDFLSQSEKEIPSAWRFVRAHYDASTPIGEKSPYAHLSDILAQALQTSHLAEAYLHMTRRHFVKIGASGTSRLFGFSPLEITAKALFTMKEESLLIKSRSVEEWLHELEYTLIRDEYEKSVAPLVQYKQLFKPEEFRKDQEEHREEGEGLYDWSAHWLWHERMRQKPFQQASGAVKRRIKEIEKDSTQKILNNHPEWRSYWKDRWERRMRYLHKFFQSQPQFQRHKNAILEFEYRVQKKEDQGLFIFQAIRQEVTPFLLGLIQPLVSQARDLYLMNQILPKEIGVRIRETIAKNYRKIYEGKTPDPLPDLPSLRQLAHQSLNRKSREEAMEIKRLESLLRGTLKSMEFYFDGISRDPVEVDSIEKQIDERKARFREMVQARTLLASLIIPSRAEVRAKDKDQYDDLAQVRGKVEEFQRSLGEIKEGVKISELSTQIRQFQDGLHRYYQAKPALSAKARHRLEELLDTLSDLRKQTRRMIHRSTSRSFIKSLIILESKLNDSDWAVRLAAATALGTVYAEMVKQEKTPNLSSLESKLNDSNPDVRRAAATALGTVYAAFISGEGGGGLEEEDTATLSSWFEAGLPYEEQILDEALALSPDAFISYYQSKLALKILTDFLEKGDPIHQTLDRLRQKGLYADSVYNRAITAYAAQRGWTSWQTGPIYVTSYGILEKTQEPLRVLPAPTGQPIRTQTQLSIEGERTNPEGYIEASLKGREKEKFLLYEPGYRDWQSYQTDPEKRPDSPPVFLLGMAPNASKVFYLTSWGEALSCCTLYGRFEGEWRASQRSASEFFQHHPKLEALWKELNVSLPEEDLRRGKALVPQEVQDYLLQTYPQLFKNKQAVLGFFQKGLQAYLFKEALEAFQFAVNAQHYEKISGHAEALNQRIRQVLREEPGSFLKEAPSQAVSKITFSMGKETAEALGLRHGAFREEIPVSNLTNLLAFLETEGVIPQAEVPPPGPLFERFGKSLELFHAIHQGKLILWIKPEPDSDWQAWNKNPWAQSFPSGASIMLRLAEAGPPQENGPSRAEVRAGLTDWEGALRNEEEALEKAVRDGTLFELDSQAIRQRLGEIEESAKRKGISEADWLGLSWPLESALSSIETLRPSFLRILSERQKLFQGYQSLSAEAPFDDLKKMGEASRTARKWIEISGGIGYDSEFGDWIEKEGEGWRPWKVTGILSRIFKGWIPDRREIPLFIEPVAKKNAITVDETLFQVLESIRFIQWLTILALDGQPGYVYQGMPVTVFGYSDFLAVTAFTLWRAIEKTLLKGLGGTEAQKIFSYDEAGSLLNEYEKIGRSEAELKDALRAYHGSPTMIVGRKVGRANAISIGPLRKALRGDDQQAEQIIRTLIEETLQTLWTEEKWNEFLRRVKPLGETLEGAQQAEKIMGVPEEVEKTFLAIRPLLKIFKPFQFHSPRAEVRLAERPSTPPRFGPIGRRAEVRTDQPAVQKDFDSYKISPGAGALELAQALRRAEVRKVTEMKEHVAPWRLVGNYRREVVAQALEIFDPVVFAKETQPVLPVLSQADQASLGRIYGDYLKSSAPAEPRAIFIHQRNLPSGPEAFDGRGLLSLFQKNLTVTVWIDAPAEKVASFRSEVQKYVTSRYGSFPEDHLLIETAPADLRRELQARVSKVKGLSGFVTEEEKLASDIEIRRGLIRSVSEPGLIEPTAFALSKFLLKEDLPYQSFTRVWRGQDLDPHWAELLAFWRLREKALQTSA